MKHINRQSIAKLVGWRHFDLAMLGAGILAYVSIGFATIGRWSIWFDEAFSAYLVRYSFADIAQYTALDVHPPLYYWTLQLWTVLFGTTEIAFRSLSLAFGIAVIVCGFLLMRRLFGRKTAYLTILFLALSPMLIRYGQEARMYAMATAISLAATYVMVIAMASKRKIPWVIYAVLVAAGMWTHYFTAVVWISHWLWRAVALRQKKQKLKKFLSLYCSREWVGAYVLAVLLFVPWMSSMFRQLFDIQSGWFWIAPVGADTMTNYFTTILFFQQHDQLSPWASLLFIIIMITLVVLSSIAFRRTKGTARINFLLIATMAFVPVALVFLASLPPLRSSFIERYLMPSVASFSLFLAMIIAIGTAKLKLWAQMTVVLVFVGTMVLGIVQAQTIGNFNKSMNVTVDTKQVIQRIEEKSLGNEPIISRTPWLFYEAVFYESRQHQVFYFDSSVDAVSSGSLAMLRGDDSHKISDVKLFTDTYSTVWYFGEPGETDIAKPFMGWKVLQSFRVDDPVTGKMRYQAVQ